MRTLLLLAAVMTAATAGAQDYRALAQARDADAFAAALAARTRDVALTNELFALEFRLRTEQALVDLARAGARPALGLGPLPAPGAPLPMIDTAALATIPDATLAQSNARVRAAAANRR
ncbi:hypothetical protein [Phenylobacterium sp.]|uniref:hypothetical protein n=1 Tax=Phenylobacterium sp. TaxID=1871053 RepID=UPI00286C5B49|nr:hypothetical protein [Phenylobacterium sp.]